MIAGMTGRDTDGGRHARNPASTMTRRSVLNGANSRSTTLGSAVFVPGTPEVVHPSKMLTFVQLPATGRYVPSSAWRPAELHVEGLSYWCTLVGQDGAPVASVSGRGHKLPAVEVTDRESPFARSCAGMPKIGACVPGQAVETVAQHLVAEQLLSQWCEHHSADHLVWATSDGVHEGLWQLEPSMVAAVSGEPGWAADLGVAVDVQPQLAWCWWEGTRHNARGVKNRLFHPDRLDVRRWPN